MRRLCCYCYTSSGFPRPTAPYPASVRYSGHQNYHKNEVSVRGAARIYGYPYCLRCGWKGNSLLRLPALTNKMMVPDVLVGRSCQSRWTTFWAVHFLERSTARKSSSCIFDSISLTSGDSSNLCHYRTEIVTVRLHMLSTSG